MQTEMARPLLYAAIEVPRELVTTTDGHTYGGDIRIGDLTGDGQVDFLVYRCSDGGMKPSFFGAFDLSGRPLWSAGEGGRQPARPMSVAIHDIDGDGNSEVISFWQQGDGDGDETSLADVAVQIRDGRTGDVKHQAAPPEITQRRGEGSNWFHQRLLIANFRGTDTPRDLVVKLGDTVVALDEGLNVLWTYRTDWDQYGKCPAYIPAVGDINGDGVDEVNGGYFLLTCDGEPLWAGQIAEYMDSVAITHWDDNKMRAICSGFGQVLDESGEIVLRLGPEVVPHGQEVRVADFRDDLPGPELVVRYNGHNPEVRVVSSDSGSVVDELVLNSSPNNTGMAEVFWCEPGERAMLFNGGWLWDIQTHQGIPLPELVPPIGEACHRMSWYHCIPANVCGDQREELVVYDPCATVIYVFTPEPPDPTAFAGYVAGPRQYNARLMD